MSIASELTRLQNAKNAITAAITEKGVTVPVGTKLDGMAALIGQIETGGGEVKLETWSGEISSKDYTEVYYIDESGIGVQKSGFIEGTLELEIDVAANTYVIAEGFASSYALTFGCEIMGVYYFAAIGDYTFIIKPNGNNFSLLEQ